MGQKGLPKRHRATGRAWRYPPKALQGSGSLRISTRRKVEVRAALACKPIRHHELTNVMPTASQSEATLARDPMSLKSLNAALEELLQVLYFLLALGDLIPARLSAVRNGNIWSAISRLGHQWPLCRGNVTIFRSRGSDNEVNVFSSIMPAGSGRSFPACQNHTDGCRSGYNFPHPFFFFRRVPLAITARLRLQAMRAQEVPFGTCLYDCHLCLWRSDIPRCLAQLKDRKSMQKLPACSRFCGQWTSEPRLTSLT